jgi:hypothetical protein
MKHVMIFSGKIYTSVKHLEEVSNAQGLRRLHLIRIGILLL